MSEIMNAVRHIITKSKYYDKDIYKSASNISELPIITKEEILCHYNDIIVPSNVDMYTETSGSTGIPLKIAWNKQKYLKSLSYLWKLRSTHSIYPTDFFLTCHTCYFVNGKRVENPVVLTDNSLSLSKLLYTEDIMQQYLNQIRIILPKWILAQPSFVYFLGKYLNAYAPDVANMFRYIELVGEFLSEEIKGAIMDLYPNATVVNMYGMQEFNGIFYSENGPMRLVDGNVYVEIVNKKGEQCEIGEEGDIIVTGLVNDAFPLIRYNTLDRGIKVCNGDSINYEITAGKSNDMFLYGEKLYDGSLFFAVIDTYNKTHKAQISKFQVIYERDILIFKLFSFEKLPSVKEIEQALERILLSINEIKAKVIVQIQHGEQFINNTQKTKYFICKK